MHEVKLGIYTHYKSDDTRYEVLGVARNTETSEKYVFYRPLHKSQDGPDFWVRPYEMFIENVEVNGELVPRFRMVENELHG